MITLATLEPAGLKHHAGLAYADAIQQGDTLQLTWDQTNEHDPQALALFHLGNKIGYVPRPANQILFALLKAGAKMDLTCPQSGSTKFLVQAELPK